MDTNDDAAATRAGDLELPPETVPQLDQWPPCDTDADLVDELSAVELGKTGGLWAKTTVVRMLACVTANDDYSRGGRTPALGSTPGPAQ